MLEKNVIPSWSEFIRSIPIYWQEIYHDFPPLVSRELIAQKTQLIARGTLANLDMHSKGIPNGRKVGKKICYPKDDALLWILDYCGVEVKVENKSEVFGIHRI